MSKETVLFQVEWSHKWDEVDFTVFPVIDRYLENEKDRQEIIEMMERLLGRIKNNEYPFSIKVKKVREKNAVKPLTGKGLVELSKEGK